MINNSRIILCFQTLVVARLCVDVTGQLATWRLHAMFVTDNAPIVMAG